MFKSLQDLVTETGPLTLMITPGPGGTLNVVVMPKRNPDKPASMFQPLPLSGTAEELDQGFANAVSEYATERRSLAVQVDATKEVLRTAKAAQVARSTKAIANAAKGADIGHGASDGANGDDDDEGEAQGDANAAPPLAAPVMAKKDGVGKTDLSSLLD